MSEDETVTNCNALKPKLSRKFLEIVVRYPKFCTYPEYEGKPYYAIKYEEKGETIIGFGTYKPEILSQYLREYFIPSTEPDNQVHLCDSCHYGYPVCSAMNNEVIFGNGKGHDNICACAKYIPSSESVRKTKVMRHKYWFGVSLNVVGEQTIGYEWICEICKKRC